MLLDKALKRKVIRLETSVSARVRYGLNLNRPSRVSGIMQNYSPRGRVRELASGMRQLAGTKTRYRRAHAAPLASLISGA